MRSTPILLLALGLTACNQQQGGGKAQLTTEQAARIAEQAEASFTGGDARAVMSQYADTAVMIDAATPAPSADRAVQSRWTESFVSMQPADYRVIGRHIQLLGPDAFVSSGIQSFTVAAGSARPSVSARFTNVFQRQKDGSWKIVHEHISMPPTPAGTAAQ